jgi:glycosyltransferase involved in cell wall biosynthesis
LNGAPIERIRLPDEEDGVRSEIFYNALLNVCQRPYNGAVVLQQLAYLKPDALPWIRSIKKTGAAISYSISQFPKWPQKPFKRIFRRAGYRKVYSEFDAIVTNSESIVGFLQDIGVTTRIEHIPNGVDLQRFHTARSDEENRETLKLRQQLGIPPHHKIITTVGAVIPRKGQDKIVKAWRQLLPRFPNTHLLIIGPRTDALTPRFDQFSNSINEIIENSGLGHQVHFTGVVEDVGSWLRASDIFVLASNREGTPNSVLEAMASSLPCLVTPYTGISESIGKPGEQYQLVGRNSENIATALASLLEDDESGRRLAERGRLFVTELADQACSLDRYARLYEELSEISLSRRIPRRTLRPQAHELAAFGRQHL